ncbi:MAG: glycosyltransferase [Bacteriovoracaceae bacterium]|nr:glycosyltransferase [Bacteriovoracaceae bacterium]
MKILFEHGVKIPVKKYGGTERVLYWLMKELVLLGHEVFLIGHPQSEVEQIGVKLIAHTFSDWRDLIPDKIDIIHLFNTPPYKESDFKVPVMVTIHGNGKPDETFFKNTVFLSKKHAANHGSDQYVYNGIDFAEYPYNKNNSRYDKSWSNFLFLAKASWKVKNLQHCMRACKKLQKHLQIAGGWRFSLSTYIHFHGMVDSASKLELLSQSSALLFPVRWHEPFGLAVIEAFSQGIPVISSSYGSLPELINDKTGVICNNYEEFEGVVGRDHNSYNPQEIRDYAKTHFSSAVMASNYVLCYEKVIAGQLLNEQHPQTKLDLGANLPF